MEDDIGQIQIYSDYVQEQMDDKRYRHTLGVVEVATDLAIIYGLDLYKARLSALFHDLAKEYPVDKKRELCKHYHIPMDDFLKDNIHLSHGLIAAKIVEDKFAIKDSNILKAINNHTLGAKNMSDLEKIIYISDIIEPSRKDSPQLNKLRILAYTDLDKAMKFALNRNIDYLTLKNKPIHPIIYSILKEY